MTWSIAAGLGLACLIGLLPYAAASRCPTCYRGWAVWPIKGRLGEWVFVCRTDFRAHHRRRLQADR